MLKSLGHTIEDATNDRMAVRLMERNDIDLVLAGVDPSDGDALELLTYVRRKHREVPVVLLFPRLHPERAKEALRLGAMAVLKYPVPAAELRAAVLQALEQCETRSSEPAAVAPPSASASVAGAKLQPIHSMDRGGPIPSLTLHSGTSHSGIGTNSSAVGTLAPGTLAASATMAPSGMMAAPQGALAVHAPTTSPAHRVDLIARELGLIGNDPSWRQVLELTATLASARTGVLIVGESGTGKSLVARLLHTLCCGAQRPFVTVEASALADELATPDGENTGPTEPGITWSHMLDQARGGTLYVHEMAALPTEIQFNLLRELQHRDYTSATAFPHLPGEIRFVMSTSENLPALIEQGASARNSSIASAPSA